MYREQFGWRADEWPNAKHIGDRTLSLPLSAKLSDGDVEDVVTAVRATLGR
ncbi:MAG: DegT/DnrJ/EryC1/StrS family aminotransferase [Planctomycetota bacterium]|nr:DegT/DnrJ/EryC1/StrS family aminotransferase [Planctomycetota bacterium]